MHNNQISQYNSKLIIVFGLPGSGKSTVADLIQQNIDHSAILRTDAIRQELYPKSEYTPEEFARVYAELYRRASELLRLGKTVILDAVFAKQDERDEAKRVAQENGVSHRFVHVDADEDMVRERISERRKRDGSSAEFDIYLKLKWFFETIRDPYEVIHNSGTLSDLDSKIQKFLNS